MFIDPGTAELAIRPPLNIINPLPEELLAIANKINWILKKTTLEDPLGHPVYDSKKSSTYQTNFTQANITNTYNIYFEYLSTAETLKFGQGFLSTDTLRIGTATIKKQTFIELTKLGPQMYSYLYVNYIKIIQNLEKNPLEIKLIELYLTIYY